jgi:hypothetical protein
MSWRPARGQGLLLPTDLEADCEPHVVAQFLSDGRCRGHIPLENIARTKVKVPDREPNRPLSVSQSVGGISHLDLVPADHGKRTRIPVRKGLR